MALLSFEHLFPSMEDDAAVAMTDPDLVEIQESPVEDDAAFAADAGQSITESAEEGTVVQSALESLALNIKMTRRLLKRHKGFEDDAEAAAGVEATDTDPVEAVIADTATDTVATTDAEGNTVDVVPDPKDLATEVAMEAFDAKKFFGGIWQGIVTAFKKIIQAIMNFVRQIQIWISGPFVKAQEKFYETNKASIGDLLKKNAAVEFQSLPVLKEKSWANGFRDLDGKVGTYLIVVEARVKEVETFLNSLTSGGDKAKGVEALKAGLKKLEEALGSLKGGSGGDESKVTAKNWMTYRMYGNIEVKPVALKITDVFDEASFEELGAGKAGVVKDLIKTTQETAKKLTKATTVAEKASKTASAAAEELKTSMQEAAKVYSGLRSGASFVVTVALGSYGAYLKHRGYLMSALKKMGAKGGPAPEAKK